MRAFLLIGHKFSGDVNLNDLAGSGRIDVITRCINAATFLSHNIRRDVLFFAYFSKLHVRLKIDTSRVKYLNPDERSTAALIRNAIVNYSPEREIRTSPGFYIKKATLEDILDELESVGKLYYLREDGEDLRTMEIEKDASFVLSDSVNLSDEEEREVMRRAEGIISVGPKSLLSSHVITIIHNELDRRGL